MGTIHNFSDSLKRSQSCADAPWWDEVYRKAFHNLEASVNVRNDGWAQRGGIDRVLTLSSGKTINIDEKVRESDWPDILLEYWSSKENKIPGWVAKDLATDYIAYAFKPSRRCYLIPFQPLRSVWRKHHTEWIEKYPIVEADNGTYTTVSVAVPIKVLQDALADVMLVTWETTTETPLRGDGLKR